MEEYWTAMEQCHHPTWCSSTLQLSETSILRQRFSFIKQRNQKTRFIFICVKVTSLMATLLLKLVLRHSFPIHRYMQTWLVGVVNACNLRFTFPSSSSKCAVCFIVKHNVQSRVPYPGLNIVFASGPIRTQRVSTQRNQTNNKSKTKQTSKQS